MPCLRERTHRLRVSFKQDVWPAAGRRWKTHRKATGLSAKSPMVGDFPTRPTSAGGSRRPSVHHPGITAGAVVSDRKRQASAKYRWTEAIVLAPSPTADAHRFIDPALTSPAANTPGKLVSMSKGLRSSVQFLGRLPFFGRSGPVII